MKKLILLIIINTTMSYAFVTVGTDANCDHNTSTLSFSILSNDEVRITNQQIYQPVIRINHSFKIIGGFDNCIDAQNNDVSNTKSVIFGNNSQTPIVMKTTASGGHTQLNFWKF